MPTVAHDDQVGTWNGPRDVLGLATTAGLIGDPPLFFRGSSRGIALGICGGAGRHLLHAGVRTAG